MIWCCGFAESFAKGVSGRPSLDFEFWKYFDSEEKYRRIYQAKKHWDPTNIFTPNIFSVGHFPCYVADEKWEEDIDQLASGDDVKKDSAIEEELRKELNNQTFIFENKHYAYANLTKLQEGERGMCTTEKKITPNSFWRLEEDKNKSGYFYIYSAPSESGCRIGKWDQGDRDVGIQYGNYSDDQLWKFVKCADADGFYRISNYKYKGACIAKWGKNDTEWGTYSGKLESGHLWKLIPRYRAQIKTAVVWECDNRMGSKDLSENVSVTVGLKDSGKLTFTSGLQHSLISSIIAVTKGDKKAEITKVDAIVDAVSRCVSLAENRPSSMTKDVTFTAPAGTNYRVIQLICDYQSPLGIDNLSVGSYNTIEETNIISPSMKGKTSFSLMDQSFI